MSDNKTNGVIIIVRFIDIEFTFVAKVMFKKIIIWHSIEINYE